MQQREPNSKIARNYISFADKRIKTAEVWLQCKRNDDNIGNLWRVHDDLYDLTDFIPRHPGGASWLTMTRGTDITEAFETHHLNMAKAQYMLRPYQVAVADRPRNIRLTFHDDGFYRTLKRRVVQRLEQVKPHSQQWMSNLIIDALLVFTYIAAILSTYTFACIPVAGLLMMWLVIGGHNYIHRRDNYRMYYFNIGFFSFREWRVSHALSHHLFPNSRVDMEMSFFDPVLSWWPSAEAKNVWNRYAAWAYEWLIYTLMFVHDFVARSVFRVLLSEKIVNLPELMPFTVPLIMYAFGEVSVGWWSVVRLWLAIVCSSGLMFGLTAFNAGHHHPEVFHDGDAVRVDMDWGIFQLDTMIDRADLRGGNRFRVLTQFGDHILHHLFPTLDHGVLHVLYGTLEETLAEFGLEARSKPWPQLIVGQHLQLARVEPSLRLSNM